MVQLVLCVLTAFVLAQDIREAPKRTRYVPPIYSDEAKAAGVKGIVVIEATIDESGAVAEARVIRSVPLLDQAALDAVKQWRFTPTTRNRQPVRTTATISVKLPIEAAPFDLTGSWTLMSYTLGEATPRVDGPFGEGFTAVQTSDDLTVDSPSSHTGRGGIPAPPVHVNFLFDGSPTSVTLIGGVTINGNTGQMMSVSNTRSTWWTTATWVGNKLQIVHHEKGSLPEHVSMKVELWRDVDGTIVVERTNNPSGGYPGGASLAWRARYRRVE